VPSEGGGEGSRSKRRGKDPVSEQKESLVTIHSEACSTDKVVPRKAQSVSKSRSMVYVALCIALMAVSAWVVIPLGPVPFTLQMFAITFAIVVLTPGQAMASVLGYLALGAIGVPVFSGMRGGIGVLAGPTGGFLWGYIFGVGLAVLLLWGLRRLMGQNTRLDAAGFGAKGSGVDPLARASASKTKRALLFIQSSGADVLAGIVFTAVAYLCGTVQYSFVAGVSLEAAFLVAVAPFIVVDLCKIVAAAACAQGVKAVLHF